ncbi:hypothetical protein B0H14DRAFT_2561815 [Mycena olivaceomarginata]|nr:hypothetical protein B0H14DRAFT_2561815 [Mycena olivaceomarginata]
MAEHHPYLSVAYLTLLILSLGFLIFNLSSVETNVQSAKSASSASASLNDSLNAAQSALNLSIAVIKAVAVDLYHSSLLCFLELVQAGLAVLTAAAAVATSISNTLQQNFVAPTSAIQDEISTPPPTPSPPDLSSLLTLRLPLLVSAARSDCQAHHTYAQLDHTAQRGYLRQRQDLTARRITLVRGWIIPPSAVLASAARSGCQAHHTYVRLDYTAQHGTCAGGNI